MREFNLKPEARIEADRKGRPLPKEMFGDNIQLPSAATPAISYGHVNSPGAGLIFRDCLVIREEFGDFKPKIEARESKTDWGERAFSNAKVKSGPKSEAKLNSLKLSSNLTLLVFLDTISRHFI